MHKCIPMPQAMKIPDAKAAVDKELKKLETKSRASIVKDSGSYAVFTEQCSSALHLTAANAMDVIARLPDCDGQAADAISAYTQVKMEDAQKLLEILKSECPDVWIRLPKHKWPKSWEYIEDTVGSS